MIKKLIDHFAYNKRALFLIDSIGAFITAFFLFIIMRTCNEYFGIPKSVLTYFSVIAICFCIYSLACFLFVRSAITIYFTLIGIANLLYCGLTIGLVINYYPLLTILGITYFLIEIVIISSLSYVELKVARKNNE
jgi:hypothetical protein